MSEAIQWKDTVIPPLQQKPPYGACTLPGSPLLCCQPFPPLWEEEGGVTSASDPPLPHQEGLCFHLFPLSIFSFLTA